MHVTLLYSIAEKPGSSSPMAMMPESFRSLFSDDDYESDSMNELQEGQEEATARVRLNN